jgi:uncharacterized protein involved in exopolysaccharide biosynthesis
MTMRTEQATIEHYSRRSIPTVRDIVAVLFRQRVAMLLAFVLATIGLIGSGMWIPKYEAEMKILVRRQRADAIVTASATAPEQFSGDQVNEEDLNTEVNLLSSEDLLRKVVLKTGLVGVGGSSAGSHPEIRIAQAVRALGASLKIEPLRKSNVISVHDTARDPKTAEAVLRALASAYMEKHLELQRSSGEVKFFDQQMQQYQQGLDQAQEKLTNFTKKTGVVSADLERDSALRQANDFDSTAHQANTAAIETEQRVLSLQTQLQKMQPRMTTLIRSSDNAQLLQQLKSTLLSLELKRIELLTKYEPTYRPVQEVEKQIADTKRTIDVEASKPVRDETSDQDPNYTWVRSELTKTQADLSGLKARAAAAASIARSYHLAAQRLDQSGAVQQVLMRTAKTQEENLILYAHKREEARVSDALDQRGILNVALAQEPVAPAIPTQSPTNALVLMLLIAGTFSISSAFAVDFMDPSFRTPDELAHYLGAPVLAALPKVGE